MRVPEKERGPLNKEARADDVKEMHLSPKRPDAAFEVASHPRTTQRHAVVAAVMRLSQT